MSNTDELQTWIEQAEAISSQPAPSEREIAEGMVFYNVLIGVSKDAPKSVYGNRETNQYGLGKEMAEFIASNVATSLHLAGENDYVVAVEANGDEDVLPTEYREGVKVFAKR